MKNLLLILLLFLYVPMLAQSVDAILNYECDETCDAVYVTAYKTAIHTRIWIKNDAPIIPFTSLYYVYIHVGEYKAPCHDNSRIAKGIFRIIKCHNSSDNDIERQYEYKLKYNGVWYYFNSKI